MRVRRDSETTTILAAVPTRFSTTNCDASRTEVEASTDTTFRYIQSPVAILPSSLAYRLCVTDRLSFNPMHLFRLLYNDDVNVGGCANLSGKLRHSARSEGLCPQVGMRHAEN